MKIWHLHELQTQQGKQHLAIDKFGWKDNMGNEKCCWEHRHIIQQAVAELGAVLLLLCGQGEAESFGHLSLDGSSAWILQ